MKIFGKLNSMILVNIFFLKGKNILILNQICTFFLVTKYKLIFNTKIILKFYYKVNYGW